MSIISENVYFFALDQTMIKAQSANLSIRAWALIQNFAPLNPWTIKQKGYVSSFERVNEFKYHENWLHNLLISGSLGGLQTGPPNPL